MKLGPADMVTTARWVVCALVRTYLFLKCEISLSVIKVGWLDKKKKTKNRHIRGNYLHYSQILSLLVHEVLFRICEICGRGEDI